MLFIYILININFSFANTINYDWRWDKDATIKYEICSDSKLKKEKVKAFIYYMIEEYEINVNKEEISVYYNYSCPTNPKFETEYNDTVFIKSFQVNQTQYAETTVNWTRHNGIKYIDNATIKYPNNLDRSIEDVVLMHEIGHSLGLGHNNLDDIMMEKIHQ